MNEEKNVEFGGTTKEERGNVRYVRPRVDVFENDEALLVVADVPGVDKASIDVRFHEGQLTIETKPPRDDAHTVLLEERYGGPYLRTFSVPDGIDADKIEADVVAGVLRVRLPKAASRRARRIEVRAPA